MKTPHCAILPPSSFARVAVMLFAALAPVAALHAQSSYTPVTFTSFAGAPLSSGNNDGTGGAARFDYPAGVAVDASGTIYVADTQNDMIRRITPSGVVTTIAGAPFAAGQGSVDGSGSAAKFNVPYAIAVDTSGTIYVSDTHNCTIRKITSGGVVTTLAGLSGTPVGSPNLGSADGTGSAASFRYPLGIGVDSTGNVFVCDSSNSTIRKITPAGVVTTFAGLALTPGSTDGTGTSARFTNPSGLAIDSSDNLYVTDYADNTIRKITPAAVVTTIAGTAGTSGSIDGIGANARFNSPFGLAVDGGGNLYIADQYNHIIRKMTPIGGVSTLGGTPGSSGTANGAGSAARFYYPAGAAVTRSGLLYIADQNNHTIRQAVVPVGHHDFNGDGKADIIWTNTTTGERAMWLMNGGTLAGGASLGTVPTDWKISGTGDFDGNGEADVVLSNSATGDRAMWLMNGGTIVSNLYLGNVPTDWVISAVGDFNGDGKADIFWSNTVTGDRSVWFMNGGTLTAGAYLGAVPVEWKVSGTGDFNGDGKSDIVWTNTTTGERAMWLMNGGTLLDGASLGIVPTDWKISGTGDFNGDGKADIVFSNTSTGDRAMWLMNGTTLSSNLYLGNVAVAWTISTVGDFNGDGKADLFWSNTVTGDRTVWLMNGGILTEGDYLGSVPVEWVNPP